MIPYKGWVSLQACNITTFDFSPPTITNILFVCTPTTMEKQNEKPTASLGTKMMITMYNILEKTGLVPPMIQFHNISDRPIFLIPIVNLKFGQIVDDRARQIQARNITLVDRSQYISYSSSSNEKRILFRAGSKGTDDFRKILKNLLTTGVKLEPGDALFPGDYLNDKRHLYLDYKEGKISIAGDRLPSAMELFRNAQMVNLREHNGPHLVAKDDEETVALDEDGTSASAQWSVEFVLNSDSVFRLKSCYGKYLAASNQLSIPGRTGCKVLQSLPLLLDSSLEWEAVMEGSHVKLRTHFGTFLRINNGHCLRPDSVTHDLPHLTTILFDVKVLKRAEEGSATKIDDKASEEGSASNIDNKASEEGSATKRHCETGEGSSAGKTPPGDSAPILESDGFRYRHHFWKLKSRLSDDFGKDVLVRGGSGTTALVREVCADVREHYDTIAWISIPQTIAWISNPQNKDSKLIPEEILLQLTFERAANFSIRQKASDFFLEQNAKCLLVVDNLDDPRPWKKFEEILRIVKTCRVIFIARGQAGSSDSQIHQHGRKFETYELEDLLNVPRAKKLEEFLDPSKGVCHLIELIGGKCETLPTAIVFFLRNQNEPEWNGPSELIKDEWEAGIPSVNLCPELLVIQQALKALYKDEGPELDHIQEVVKFLKDERLFCFLYLCIFPENRPISCERVSRLWAAEGFLPNLGREEHFFEYLRRRGWINPVEQRSDGELSTFQVDKRAREIFFALSNLRSNLVTRTSRGSTDWPERVRYLSVQGTIRALNVQQTSKLSSIFTLDVSSNEEKTTTFEASPVETPDSLKFKGVDLTSGPLQIIPATPFDKTDVKYLSLKSMPIKTTLEASSVETSDPFKFKVVDLTSAPCQIVPATLFDETDVKYLSLRSMPIKTIPSSIEKLTHLEFLDAKHSLVTNLPRQFARLKKIRHILIYHREEGPLMESYLIGFKALCRVGKLKCLEKLCFVEANKRLLKDLGNLTKLRRLGITKLRKQHGKLLCSSLEKLLELKSLNVHAFDEDEILDLHDLTSPPKSLKHLYLHGRLEKLPDWISSLNNLTKIILRWSQLEVDLLATLGKLQKLVELELRGAYYGKRLDFKEGQFPKLNILLLEELDELRSMNFEKGTLKSLEELTISRCQWLEKIPSSIEHICNIRKLTFFDMSDEFYDKLQKDDYEKIKDKVYFKRWRAGHWETREVEGTDEAHCSH